ncbi:biotin/lipoyl-containing protein, partial [Pseudomonas sp. NY15181]|uniref:biotin/lipoyl-containing protein n=1 Tax=Pseudomonas sp. NY15181 TaxID=3400349 RepID=UPI003A874500
MTETIRVPDIGNGQGEVIELLVKVGDRVEAEQSLLTLESDKASMEIPCPRTGVVKAIKVKVGDTLKEGDAILELEAEGASTEAPAQAPAPPAAAAPKPTAAAAPQPISAGGGLETIKVPDIGNGQGEIIELMVKVGDRIEADQSLLTLESDKASMEIPAPKAGVVKAIKVKIGDTLKEGDDILELETEGGAPAASAPSAPAPVQAEKPAAPPAAPVEVSAGGVETIRVPDIGNGEGQVIELMIKVGDNIAADQSLLTLESDKASMEIPAPKAGVVKAIKVKIGDTLKEGDEILELEVTGGAAPAQAPSTEQPAAAPTTKAEQPRVPEVAPVGAPSREGAKVHAGPAVRMVAREFGVELSEVKGTGPKGRILKEDVQAFVKEQLQRAKSAPAGATGGAGIPPIPEVDFSKFGEVEEVAMTRLMQVGAANLHRSWL